MANAVRVLGLRDLQRAFGAADKAVQRDMKDALLEAAAPVRNSAQALAGTVMRRLQPGRPWTYMRVGASGSIVWVAPVERGTRNPSSPRARGQRTKAPRFADQLIDEAMSPALERNVQNVERRVEQLLDEVADVWERV